MSRCTDCTSPPCLRDQGCDKHGDAAFEKAKATAFFERGVELSKERDELLALLRDIRTGGLSRKLLARIDAALGRG